jgi:hypothetical protein
LAPDRPYFFKCPETSLVISNMLTCFLPLHHWQDFLLGLACFFANPDYEITFCHKF